MKKIQLLCLCLAFAIALAHDGDDHYEGSDAPSKDDYGSNDGDGYKDFVPGNTLATFSVAAGVSQSFTFQEGAKTFTLNVLLSGNGTYNLTVDALSSLGSLNWEDRFRALSRGFSLAYSFRFSGRPNVTSVTLSLELGNGEIANALKQLTSQSNFGLFFVSAFNRYLGRVEVKVSENSTTGSTSLQFTLLPTARAVYFFSTFNGTSLPILFNTKQNHNGKERVKLSYDKGLLLDFINGRNCTSFVSFRDSDKNLPPRNFSSMNKFFDVEVTDQDGLNATLVFAYNLTELAAKGLKPRQLRWALLAANGTWIIQAKSRVDESKRELQFDTSHFSTWGVFSAADSSSGDTNKAASSSAISVAPVATLFAAITLLVALVL